MWILCDLLEENVLTVIAVIVHSSCDLLWLKSVGVKGMFQSKSSLKWHKVANMKQIFRRDHVLQQNLFQG